MKLSSIFLGCFLFLIGSVFAGPVKVYDSKGTLLATLGNACRVGTYDFKVLNLTASINFDSGSKIQWKTKLGESGTYGVGATIPVGGNVKIPVKKKDPGGCKAKVFLP